MKKYIMLGLVLLPLVLVGQKDAAQLFEPDLIRADIDTLITKLMLVHPTFKNHYETHNVESRIDSIKANIKTPMSSIDFFRMMQPFVVVDGHTTLRSIDEISPGVENPLFPFRVIIHNNTLYIKENLTDNKSLERGSIIESINGLPTPIVIANLTRYIPGEKYNFKTKSLEHQFHIYLALVYGSFSQFTLTVNNAEFNLSGATWGDFYEPSKPKFELRFYDDDIAYIYKRKFMPPRDFLHFMDSAFTAISEKQVKHLIIDNLNGGGMTDLADSLMSYFTDQPYGLMEKKVTKLSPMTKDYIAEKMTEGYLKDGFFILEYPERSHTRHNKFNGSTYILTGPLSYSTATCFPAAAKCYGNAFIVGEESGQPLISNGGQDSFTLPNTGVPCITSLSVVYMPGHNGNRIDGVFPDYEVRPTLDDQLNDTDYLLDYTLRLIRSDPE